MLAFQNGGGGGPKDNFKSAEIVEDANKFDATQYSFFGDAPASAALGGLELDGALEDGPIEDDELDYGLDGIDADDQLEEEDLSLAGLFATRAQVEDASPAAAPAAALQQQQKQQPQQQPFLQDSEVITTPARARRPASPSLRLTPGAPASTRQDEPPGSSFGMRGMPGMDATPAGLSVAAMNLTQLLQPQFQPSAAAQGGTGRVVGPTSVADLEAQMLAQVQPHSPAPMPVGNASHYPPDSNGGFGMRDMHPGLGGMSPYAGPMQQAPEGMHGQHPGQQVGYLGGPSMPTFPGQGMLSPYPGQPPMQPGPVPMQHQSPAQGQYMQQGPGPMHQQLPYGHMMQGAPPPPPRFPGAPLPHGQVALAPSPHPGTPPPPPPPFKGYPHPLHHPGQAGPQQQHVTSPYQQQQRQQQHLQGPPPAVRPGGPPPPPPQQQQSQSPGYPVRPPHFHLQQGLRPSGGYPQQGQGQAQRGASPARGPGSSGSGGPRRGGMYMSEEEVETIMRIMYAAVHTGHSYAEDYYFQAYLNAHCNGANDVSFEPGVLRDLSEGVASLDPSASVKFVPIEGLGKIVYSNLRTPRVLLDFGAADKDGADSTISGGGGEGAAGAVPLRPLEQEPLLAARIMIEDCLNLLLDVDDVDRRFKATMTRAARAANTQMGSGAPQSPLPGDAVDLMQRRMLLLAGIVSSFRLPHLPAGGAAAAAKGAADGAVAACVGDRVFRRVMALPKGRKLLARTLLVLSPPVLPATLGVAAVPNLDPLQLLWAGLRNVGWLFGSSMSGLEPAAEKALAEATTRMAACMAQAVGKLREACDLVSCLEALTVGLKQGGGGAPGMLPLVRTRRVLDEDAAAPREWLAEVVVRLLLKADELGLGISSAGVGVGQKDGGSAVPATERSRWQVLVASVGELLAGHLEALSMVHAAAAAAGSSEALAMVGSLGAAAQPVVQAALAHVASDQARTRLRGLALSVS